MKMYEIGGCVRDRLLGIESKDIDYTVVFDDGDLVDVEDPFTFMVEWLENMDIRIFKDSEGVPIGAKFLTARGIAPATFPKHPGRALDFVLARTERGYSDGRRPDVVEPGTLYDDQARRDFTMNAIAEDDDGNLIDPFNGVDDIEQGIIRAVGDPMERLTEDALRAVRALRFSVTKRVKQNDERMIMPNFKIESSLSRAMMHSDITQAVKHKISDERIKDELNRMFAVDTLASLRALTEYRRLTEAMFSGTVSLEATMKQRGK